MDALASGALSGALTDRALATLLVSLRIAPVIGLRRRSR